MADTANDRELLFSYGTLQLESVQLATFGRTLTGTQEALPGFELSTVKIVEPSVIEKSGNAIHKIVRYTGRCSDIVYGTVYPLTVEELNNADSYEVDAYRRVAANLATGRRVWVYVDVKFAPPELPIASKTEM